MELLSFSLAGIELVVEYSRLWKGFGVENNGPGEVEAYLGKLTILVSHLGEATKNRKGVIRDDGYEER